jgi:hypothetical protein
MTFRANKEEKFHIDLYTVSIQGISTIFTDQLQTVHVFNKADIVLASKFST